MLSNCILAVLLSNLAICYGLPRGLGPPEVDSGSDDGGHWYEPQEVVVVFQLEFREKSIMFNSFEKELTVFRDTRSGQCFLSPLLRDKVFLRVHHISTYRPIQQFAERYSEDNLYLRTQGSPVANVRELYGDDIADLCQGLITFKVNGETGGAELDLDSDEQDGHAGRFARSPSRDRGGRRRDRGNRRQRERQDKRSRNGWGEEIHANVMIGDY